MSSERPLLTMYQASKEFRVDRQALDRKLQLIEPVKEVGRNRYYTIHQIFDAITKGPKRDPLDEQRLRLATAQAEKAELQVEEMAGQLLDVSEFEDYLIPMLSNFRARMLALPAAIAVRVAPLTDTGEIQDEVMTLVRAALEELATYDVKTQAGKDSRRH